MVPSLVKKVILMKFPVFFCIIGAGFLFWTSDLSYFMIIAFASLLFSLNLAGESIFYSYNWMGTYALIPLARLVSRAILVIILFYLFYSTGIILGLFAAPLIAFSLSLYLSFRLLPKKHIALDQPFKKHFAFGFWIYISVVIRGITFWVITILAKQHLGDTPVVGYFGVGSQICFSVTMLVLFINESILPSLVEFYVIKDHKFKYSLQLAWKYTNMLVFPLIFGAYVLAEPLIAFFIGKEYIPGTHIIKLFFPAVIFFSWIRFHTQILFVYEKKIKIFLTQFIILAVFLGSWFYIIHHEEINFASLSLGLGALIGYLFIGSHSHKIEKVKNYVPSLLKPLAAASLMALILNLFDVHSLTQLVSLILLGILSYGSFLFLLKGVGKDDYKILKDFLKSIKVSGKEKKGSEPQ